MSEIPHIKGEVARESAPMLTAIWDFLATDTDDTGKKLALTHESLVEAAEFGKSLLRGSGSWLVLAETTPDICVLRTGEGVVQLEPHAQYPTNI